MDGKDGGPSHDAPWTGYMCRKRTDPTAILKKIVEHINRVMVHFIVWRRLNLSYAEALNEWSIENGTYAANLSEILKYVNRIRQRAGIPQYGYAEGEITPPASGEEMRTLIRQERRVELNCECGLRFNDLRRWKLAKDLLDGDFYAMNAYAQAGNRDDYYKRVVYETRKFISYWFPIPQDDIDKNTNLRQTPDWIAGN